MARRVPFRVSLAAVLAGLCGCGSVSAPSAPPPRPVPAQAAAQDTWATAPWGQFHSRRFHLLIPLPDGKTWQIDDHRSQWLSATHPASQSELLVRVWRDPDRMNRTRCEEQARLWRALPDRAGVDIVAARRVNVPPEHDTNVEVGVSVEQAGKPLQGFAMAFGGWAHGCFAYVYTTRAMGNSAASVLSERLAAMVDRSLSKIVVESDLEPVIPKEPVP